MSTPAAPEARRFKPYPEYRDSGVEWLGEIPAHWEVKRISELAVLVNGFPFDSEYFVRGGGVPLVRIRDLYAAETEVNYIGPVVEDAWIETGDVIIGMDGDFNVARWRGLRALLNQRMCCLRPRSGADSGFVASLLPVPLKVMNDLTYATTVKHLSSTDVRKIRFGAPPEPEQRAIAAFLDRETAPIDALVAKKERLIELLQEKRTALITRAVTKGLDPTVPMKDSGVEWLGQVPVHWKVERADSFLRNDKIQIEPSEISDELVFHYSIPSVQATGDGQLEPPSDIDSAKLRIVGNRVLVSKLNPRKGVVLIATEQNVPTICSTEFVPFEVRGSELGWALYLFSAESTRQRLSAVVRSATRSHQRAEVSEIAKMWHGVPPLPEQRAIAAFLDRETARTDALVAKVREAIERLQELRAALISAAVTGRIDVREGAA